MKTKNANYIKCQPNYSIYIFQTAATLKTCIVNELDAMDCSKLCNETDFHGIGVVYWHSVEDSLTLHFYWQNHATT